MTTGTLTFDNNLTINWGHGLDGGGSDQYIDFLNYLKKTGKKYKNCLEWCSGLGAIGYSILDANLCDTITFVDAYEPAKIFALENAKLNNISHRVSAFHINKISDLPDNLKFDLVVANPPHCDSPLSSSDFVNEKQHEIASRLIVDLNWEIHNEFFSNIKKYLTPNADIILSENCFRKEHIFMAEKNELVYVESITAPILSKYSTSDAVLMVYKNEKKVY